MKQRRTVIAGGSGFIGCAIADALAARGDDVVILTRSPRDPRGQIRDVRWDGRTVADTWLRQLDGADAVINLAGKNVNCRYTRRALDEIDRSRENAVRTIGEAINRCANPPAIMIQASTTAIYGDRGDSICDETSPVGEGIPVDTATKWERAFASIPTPRTRRVLLRMPFVLGRDGGVLKMLATMARCFLGGAVGNGRQYISWIHIDDLVRIKLQAIDHAQMSGLYIAASPNAVTNADFMRELRRAVLRPWSPPVPAIMVRLGCLFLRTEPVLALTGRRAMPRRLTELGFDFHHPDLHRTLESLTRT
ncbi:MAG: TIGR01777 family protein [Anaerolineae bacterium]|nr:TIGR01777 family protein [Phycisphaerae bacterium]